MTKKYFCNKCKKQHFISSSIGKKHRKSSNLQKRIASKKTSEQQKIRNIKSKTVKQKKIYIENKHPKFRKRSISRNIENKYPEFQKRLFVHIGGDKIFISGINEEFFNMYPQHKNFLESIENRGFYPIKKEQIPKEIIGYNQNILRKKFKLGYVILYRGDGDYKNINKRKQLLSWTTDKGEAWEWAQKRFGHIIKAKIPIKDIMISHLGSEILKEIDEREFIVKPGNANIINVYNLSWKNI